VPISQAIQSVTSASNTAIRNLPGILPTQAPTLDVVSAPPIDYTQFTSV
jgi:hypothetical protein